MLLLLLPPLLQTHRTAVLMSTTGYFAGQSTAVVEILQSSAPGQQAAPLYFAGQSTAVVEILQSSAPGLVMVMMMVGNAAAVGAGDGRCCYWYRSASFLVVTSAPGQSASYSFAQSTDWFCS